MKRPDLVAKMVGLSSMRIGMAGYAAILGSVRIRPMSTTELAAKHKVSRLLILGLMRHCLRAGVVHRVDWFRPQPHARMVPHWALGQDGDISMPMYEEKARRPRRAQSTLITLTTALELMGEHPHSRKELAEALCMHEESASRIVNALRTNKLIHVASWHKPQKGTTVQEFGVGQLPDAPRPPQISRCTKTMKQYRARREQRAALHALAGVALQPMRAAA
jgi:hypothetical protein